VMFLHFPTGGQHKIWGVSIRKKGTCLNPIYAETLWEPRPFKSYTKYSASAKGAQGAKSNLFHRNVQATSPQDRKKRASMVKGLLAGKAPGGEETMELCAKKKCTGCYLRSRRGKKSGRESLVGCSGPAGWQRTSSAVTKRRVQINGRKMYEASFSKVTV